MSGFRRFFSHGSAKLYKQVGLATFAVGLLWRIFYVFVEHPPENYVYSDMEVWTTLGLRAFQPGYVPSIMETYISPGPRILWGWLIHLDPTYLLSKTVIVIMSSLLPWLIFGIALKGFSRASAYLALALSSLYFPFFYYGGFFASELPFQFFLMAALWFITLSQKKWPFAFLAGACWAMATSMKALLMPTGILMLAAVAFAALKFKRKSFVMMALAGVAGFALFATPFALDCTRYSGGQFCMFGNMKAYHFLLGHQGPVNGVQFLNSKDPHTMWIQPPSQNQTSFTPMEHLEVAFYDEPGLYSAAFRWIKNHLALAAMIDVHRVFQLLFSTTSFPENTQVPVYWIINLFNDFFVIGVVPFACVYLISRRRKLLSFSGTGLTLLFFFVTLLGLVAAAAMTLSEVRYRFPFDGLILILACQWICIAWGSKKTARARLEPQESLQ